MNRQSFVDWVPKKVETKLLMQENGLNLEKYRSQTEGIQEGEVALPEEQKEEEGPQFNPDSMNQITMMGFPELSAQHALM